MALSFADTKGKAQKNTPDSYVYTDGEQHVRLFGNILPRYVYWIKGTNNKDIPVECLSFDREKERFTNVEVDWVPKYYPDKKCTWSYSINCLDPKDGKVKVLNLKKKLFEQIQTAAEDLGDPTNPETGWDVVFKKVKTGPLAYNVEYTLQVLRCKHRALNETELAAIQAAESIDVKVRRATADEVKGLLDKIQAGTSEEAAGEGSAASEAVNELS